MIDEIDSDSFARDLIDISDDTVHNSFTLSELIRGWLRTKKSV
jgi:hypothetical protein